MWVEDGISIALGIGPADRASIAPITRRFKLYGAAMSAKGMELSEGGTPSGATIRP
jgi:hypothetical protein